MTISNIFSLTNGGAGNGVTKAAFSNAGKAAPDPVDALFKQVKTATAPASIGFATGDSVGISDLAQALKGPAAEFFSHMDDKARGKLEELVKSGRVSVDEAVQGLQFWADETSFMKAMGKVPLTSEEKSAANKEQELREAFNAKGQTAAAATKEVERITEEYSKALDAGSTDLKDILARLEAAQGVQDTIVEEMRGLGAAMGELRGNGSAVFSRRFQVVAEAKAASGHPDGAVMYNPVDKKAADKLSDAGLGQVQLKGAITSYGAAVAARAG